MTSLLQRTSLRHVARHPGRFALTVLGVALGVAVVVGIDLAVESARQAFRLSTETVAGRATHRIEAGSQGVDEEVFRRVRLGASVPVAPVVEGWASSPALPGRALRVLGVDPFSEGPFRPWLAGTGVGPGVDVGELVGTHRGVLLSRTTARQAAVEPGDRMPLIAGGRRFEVTVLGVLAEEDETARQGLLDLVVADVAAAQEMLDMVGRLSHIEVSVPESGGTDAGPGEVGGGAGERGADEAIADEAILSRLRSLLPVGVELTPTGTRAATMADMIAAFDLNLRALSLLALVFGMFLIYNALTFSVVQRRELLGTLRALGTTRREVLGLVLGEAAVVGVLGSALGLLLGVAMGRGLVRLVTRTINDLYFALSVQGLAVDPGVLAKGALLGVGATLVAAALPALEAANAPPRAAWTRSVVEERWRRLVPRTLGAGMVLLTTGGLTLLVIRDLTTSFAALFAVVLGMALLTPAATVFLMAMLRPLLSRTGGILGAMAARGVVTTLSRTAPAIAALMVAVSVTVGLGVMITSFRSTVARWLDRTLQADVYVSAPSPVASRAEGTLDPAVVDVVTAHPAVVGANIYRNRLLDSRYGDVRLMALDLDPRGERAFDFREGEAHAAFRAFRREGAVLVSEPFSYRHGIHRGSSLLLPTPRGERSFPVAGVYYDYGSERGVVVMARSTFDDLWEDPGVTSVALFLRDRADVTGVLDELRGELAGMAGTVVALRSNRALRDASLEVFDRTFAITGVLRGLAFVVAFIGVLSALMALQLERVREIGMLRANGMTPGQVWTLITAQTGLMGATAGLLAVPAGLVLAVVMIHVVNRRSFGWTLQMEVGPGVLLQALALAVAGALVAGVYPAWRMSRTRPAEALRSE